MTLVFNPFNHYWYLMYIVDTYCIGYYVMRDFSGAPSVKSQTETKKPRKKQAVERTYNADTIAM